MQTAFTFIILVFSLFAGLLVLSLGLGLYGLIRTLDGFITHEIQEGRGGK